MGESTNPRATLRFDRRVRLEFRGATITSDAGLLACRELDDALGLTETANECLQESRGGRNVQHRLVGLLRQSVYSRLAGYEDTNDAERLAQDPTMRIIVGRRGGPERPAASTNTMSRFETEVLTQSRLFFSKFTERYLNYFLEREASASMASVSERDRLASQLSEHIDGVSKFAFETSRITQSFAAGWFNNYARDRYPSKDESRSFLNVAIGKMREELRREADAHE